jgi:hypothetical protein
MHDIKYFFSIKMIRQFEGRREGAKKIFKEKKTNYQKRLFFKIQRSNSPGPTWIRPCFTSYPAINYPARHETW